MVEEVSDTITTSVEIPTGDYVRMVLLVAEREYPNLAEIIREGVKRVLEEYEDEYFEELKSKYAELVEDVLKRSTRKVRKLRVGLPRRKRNDER